MTRDPKDLSESARIDRRDFLLTTGAGSAALALGGGGREGVRRIGPTQAVPSQMDFPLEEATVTALQHSMATGELTSGRITELYLARIEQMDRSGPKLAAVIETNPDAMDVAARLDAERRQGHIRGPLHGVPVLIKDNIDTHDRMTTTAGSFALEGSIPLRDAFVADRLRTAGAVILGKANLSEWANFRSTRSSSGWSGRGGQCRNPFSLDRSPCGSSSGSGAAASANFCAVAVGTETDGSVVCPSATNGVVGIKPTVGLVSRSGIIPISHSQDTAGPMARSVADAAIMLGAMAGRDPRDDSTGRIPSSVPTDYTRFLERDGLRGARIGVARTQFFGYSPPADDVVEEAIRAMARAGATIVDPADIPNVGDIGDPEYTVLLFEFKADLNAYLAGLGPEAPARTLTDLIAFNEANADREMPYFGQEIFLQAEAKGSLLDREYVAALETSRRLAGPEGIDVVMAEHRLDAIVAPTNSPAWTIDLVNGDHYQGSSSGPAAVAGYASITVPAGHVHGLPVGVSFLGGAWSEPTLIRLAYAFEQATQARRAPTFPQRATP